ncbi:MAG TPA: hypothetical protein PLI66_03685 [Spirochaetales bacterium]|nr:hypothetical protein [Spirochaetales bacterium]
MKREAVRRELVRRIVGGAWAPGSRVPATWRVLHGPDDRVGLYDDAAFELVARFLERLAALRVPAMIP